VIGTLLNERFRLDEKIGAGGMSTVYRAFDPTLERWVAIKLMHRDISEEADQLERFRREARAVARLSHPHVVTVIDFGEDGGTPYIVLEYVEGETLKDRIRRLGRLPVDDAVAYAIEIGRALTAAHAERLVHRDVKPQNVLIDVEGRAKVTDFGIARSLEAEGLTAEGRVLGTTDYVAPEQALGQEVTEQSDVYSLGVVLYEMLTGEVPFTGSTQVAVAMQHIREPLPDVQRRRPEVSATLAAVVEQATAKETASRYLTAADLVADLEEVLTIEIARAGESHGEATSVLRTLSEHDTSEFVPARLRHPVRWLASVLLVLVLAGGAIAYFATRTERGAGPAATPGGGGLSQVRLSSDAANDYDPQSEDTEESPEATQNAIDGNPSTNWDTETYESDFASLGKEGVGLYVDTGSELTAQRLNLTTSTPGFTATVYAANEVPDDIGGWEPISEPTDVTEEERISLEASRDAYRYYLVWITELGDEEKVEIQELAVYE